MAWTLDTYILQLSGHDIYDWLIFSHSWHLSCTCDESVYDLRPPSHTELSELSIIDLQTMHRCTMTGWRKKSFNLLCDFSKLIKKCRDFAKTRYSQLPSRFSRNFMILWNTCGCQTPESSWIQSPACIKDSAYWSLSVSCVTADVSSLCKIYPRSRIVMKHP